MLIIKNKIGNLRASQFLAHKGYWDIYTEVSLLKDKRVSISIMLQIPVGKKRKWFPCQDTKNVNICRFVFPSVEHLKLYGKLLVEFSKALECGNTNG